MDFSPTAVFHCPKCCIYRIIAETDLTIYIVGADRGIYLPALGPSKTNASPPPTNDGVKVGNSSTVKSQEGGWWQKVAKEYKFCTLHVPCHSQVKHMRIPMASALSRGFIPTCGDGVKIPMVPALSRFPFQRLSTGYSHFIDGFPQIRQGFMGVNAFVTPVRACPSIILTAASLAPDLSSIVTSVWRHSWGVWCMFSSFMAWSKRRLLSFDGKNTAKISAHFSLFQRIMKLWP